MRSITHCPVCLFQFFVSEEQLNQHRGQVRCGHCLNVFDANVHSIPPVESLSNEAALLTESTTPIAEVDAAPIDTSNETLTYSASEVSTHFASDSTEAAIVEILATAEVANNDTAVIDQAEDISTLDVIAPAQAPNSELPADVSAEIIIEGANEHIVVDEQANYFDYLTAPPPAKTTSRPSSALSLFLIIGLLLLAMMQSLYFLRNPIALYYPNLKPYLQQTCHKLGCRIDLPKKIELIIIEDSDMQEDANHAGLINLSASLINQASFHQAYPNLELTLTDVEDKPTLRRLLKPNEYLPKNTNIQLGIAPTEVVRVNLAISVGGLPVAGYRVFVSY